MGRRPPPRPAAARHGRRGRRSAVRDAARAAADSPPARAAVRIYRAPPRRRGMYCTVLDGGRRAARRATVARTDRLFRATADARLVGVVVALPAARRCGVFAARRVEGGARGGEGAGGGRGAAAERRGTCLPPPTLPPRLDAAQGCWRCSHWPHPCASASVSVPVPWECGMRESAEGRDSRKQQVQRLMRTAAASRDEIEKHRASPMPMGENHTPAPMAVVTRGKPRQRQAKIKKTDAQARAGSLPITTIAAATVQRGRRPEHQVR